jgi:5-methylcytosine-specific restriction endonuclease McrA
MSDSSKKAPSRARPTSDDFYYLDPAHTDPARVKRERARAQELKKSGWWKGIVAKGICHYCEKKFKAFELTMDHVVPIARGGSSVKGNVVPACRACNATKKLDTPVDQIFKQLEAERAARQEEE